MAQVIFSTSSPMPELTAELPMLALIFTRKLRPMAIGSISGWLMLAGMMARPRAISSRTNSGVMAEGMAAPKDWRMLAQQAFDHLLAIRTAGAQRFRYCSRRRFSRMATNSISGVMMPRRA